MNNTFAHLWLHTREGWRLRADQVVAIAAKPTSRMNRNGLGFDVLARVSHAKDDDVFDYVLASFADDKAADRCVDEVLRSLAARRGAGQVHVSDRSGEVSISDHGDRQQA